MPRRLGLAWQTPRPPCGKLLRVTCQSREHGTGVALSSTAQAPSRVLPLSGGGADSLLYAERLRIARELHDVVTHHVSVIVIQAGAGLRALDRRPEGARTALQAVDRTGREALADMRRMLGILGSAHDDHGDIRDGQGLAPQPGLARLGELVEQVRAAGSPVELSIEGEQRQLDAGVELSAYRIVQEALTNVLKHAHGARARVDLRYGARALDIVVTDEGGTGRRDLGEPAHEGRGLIGMTERATLFGGTLEAGPTPTGFRVVARLPTDIAANAR